jgi:predicted amidophosphoribosyltransferase
VNPPLTCTKCGKVVEKESETIVLEACATFGTPLDKIKFFCPSCKDEEPGSLFDPKGRS